MTDAPIPDELRVQLASGYVRENFESGEPWSMTIARAILAERERCAAIAEQTEIPSSDLRMKMAITVAARAIRRGRHLTKAEKLENVRKWLEAEERA